MRFGNQAAERLCAGAGRGRDHACERDRRLPRADDEQQRVAGERL